MKNEKAREKYAEKTSGIVKVKQPMTAAERVAKHRAKQKENVVVEPVIEEVVELPENISDLPVAEKVLLCNPVPEEPLSERDIALAKLRARKSEITMKPTKVPI